MKFTSEMIKKAWDQRRKAAKRHGCKVTLISWSECIKRAIVLTANINRAKAFDKAHAAKIATRKPVDTTSREGSDLVFVPSYGQGVWMSKLEAAELKGF